MPKTKAQECSTGKAEAAKANLTIFLMCAVCGHELMTIKDVVEKYTWSDFPGKKKLVSVQRHSAQYTLNNCLLHPQGVIVEDHVVYVQAYAECYHHLCSTEEG